MTTHAKGEQQHDHGAPQSGGMSGVAAQPGEGALRYRGSVGEALDNLTRAIEALPTNEHASFARLCLGELVRRMLAAPAPSSPRAECGCAECCCAVIHDDPCGEAPEAEPADAAAALREACGHFIEATMHDGSLHLRAEVPRETVERWRKTYRAALRRAAPGAAPEPRWVDGLPIATPAPTGERIARVTMHGDAQPSFVCAGADGLLPWERVHPSDTEGRAAVQMGTFVPDGTATAPTGGEAVQWEALMRHVERAQWAVMPQANGGWVISCSRATGGDDYDEVELARTRGSLLEALNIAARASAPVWGPKRPAPVAAPRGTQGRDDA